ncbi:hypothetical protein COM47_20525 [Bacillus wiedmannii]|uniref:hypothetical protein n=1 Tax=Bacillus wiedmannii TaxID=1890302 RepID=UPI000BF6413E|nr:hypothetical protein [Bacillus wiedmannii]PGD82304.1 hypothetical protein COM47_20525 [Bacillus wiedmannii]
MKIFKQSIVGEYVYHMYVNVDYQFSEHILKADKETWDVASYRFKDNKIVEHYTPLGSGWKVGENSLALFLNDPKVIREEVDSLTTSNSLMKKALIFVPKENSFINKTYSNVTKKAFETDFIPEINRGGLVAWPAENGFHPLAVTCSCKGVFGGSSGCTNPTCQFIGGFCQSNTECKKTDMLSVCSCKAN